MSVLDVINILREQHGGISINKFEKEAGLSRGSVAKWAFTTPSADKLQKAANYFGVSVEYLLTGQQKSPAPNEGNGGGKTRDEVIAWLRSLTAKERLEINLELSKMMAEDAEGKND